MADKNKKILKNIFKNEWVRIVGISVLSILISIICINNNIEREKQKIFTDMKSKIKVEVEKDLYKELSEKFKDTVRSDLKKEYRDFVKMELKKNLREDTFRALKHQIDTEGADLSYEIFESIEYKKNGENIQHCEVVVKNLDKIFNEELEGLFKQIFGKNKNGVLLVFPQEPEQNGYRPQYRIERGNNDQILVIEDNVNKDIANTIIS